MTHARRFARIGTAAWLAVTAAFLPAGCSIGYVNLHPGENSALYSPLFADLITAYDDPHWLWVRGALSLDADGDGKVEEEAVVATIQKGTESNPGPIEAAFLVLCRKAASGERRAIARTLLFRSDPRPGAPRSRNDLGAFELSPLTQVRAQAIPDKISLAESVAVYFQGAGKPSWVWYVGYALRDGRLVKNLETSAWQEAPGIAVVNLDKSIESRHSGYQLIIGAKALPDETADKLGPKPETPLWGHVYAKGPDGMYVQADERYGEQYKRLEPAWNQAFVKATLLGLPPEEMAWLEYHMGLLKTYVGNRDDGVRLLERAGRNARDARLKERADMALEHLAETGRKSGAR